MSVYKDQFLQTMVVDPVFSNNNRCVFKIPALVCVKKSVCLGDLGVTTTGVPNYNAIGGVANIIKTISLRVAGTQIDFNNRVNVSNALQYLRSNPTSSNNIHNKTTKNSLDFANSLVTYPLTVAPEAQFQRVVVSNSRPTVTANADGLVYLYELLQFFNGNHNVSGVSSELLPLYMFKTVGDIELTIEWQTDPTKAITTNTALTVRPPVLIMDCFDKSNPIYDALDSLKSAVAVNYSRWEHESLQYTATALGAQVRERLNQPAGKFVKRLCMLTNADVANVNLADTRSASLPDENIQLIVNGKQVLDFRSEKSAEKVMHFCNAWGDYICPPQGRNYGDVLNTVSNTMDAQLNTLNPLVGNTSLFGVVLNSRVEYMELDYRHNNDLILPVPSGELNFIFETDNIVGVVNGQISVSF